MKFEFEISESLSYYKFLIDYKKNNELIKMKNKISSKKIEEFFFNKSVEEITKEINISKEVLEEFNKIYISRIDELKKTKNVLENHISLIKKEWIEEITEYFGINNSFNISVVIILNFNKKRNGSANMKNIVVLEPDSLVNANLELIKRNVFIIFHEALHILIRKSKKFEKIKKDVYLEEAIIEAITNYYFYPDLKILNYKIKNLSGVPKDICIKAKKIIKRNKKNWVD